MGVEGGGGEGGEAFGDWDARDDKGEGDGMEWDLNENE